MSHAFWIIFPADCHGLTSHHSWHVCTFRFIQLRANQLDSVCNFSFHALSVQTLCQFVGCLNRQLQHRSIQHECTQHYDSPICSHCFAMFSVKDQIAFPVSVEDPAHRAVSLMQANFTRSSCCGSCFSRRSAKFSKAISILVEARNGI